MTSTNNGGQRWGKRPRWTTRKMIWVHCDRIGEAAANGQPIRKAVTVLRGMVAGLVPDSEWARFDREYESAREGAPGAEDAAQQQFEFLVMEAGRYKVWEDEGVPVERLEYEEEEEEEG